MDDMAFVLVRLFTVCRACRPLTVCFLSNQQRLVLQGQPAAFMKSLHVLIKKLTEAQAKKERSKVVACLEAFRKDESRQF